VILSRWWRNSIAPVGLYADEEATRFSTRNWVVVERDFKRKDLLKTGGGSANSNDAESVG
jgi:hypothetical protein